MSVRALDWDRNHGEVFTRRWIVELILDLAGYTADRDLAVLRTVEPSCGSGAFLGPMVERLIESCRRHGRDITTAHQAIQATDVLPDNVAASREVVREILANAGVAAARADDLVQAWINTGDYPLSQPEHEGLFGALDNPQADFVIGNPPYIRPEDVPTSLYDSYRRACSTMLGRADVYVGFFEAALRSLPPGGVVAFICADRWMRNQYGRGLRSLISNEYAIDLILPMHDVDAFEAQVSAYPAVVILRNGALGSVALGEANAAFQPAGAAAFTAWAHGTDEHLSATGVTGTRLAKWTGGDASWPGGDPEMVAIIEQLNERFELLGTRTPAPASALAWPPEPTSSLSPPNTILSKATAFYR